MSIEDVATAIKQAAPHKHEWKAPVFFGDIQTPPIPSYLLPAVLRAFVDALSLETETPAEMSIACALGIVSVALTGKFVVRPYEGWVEPVNTYWFIELAPGNLKSKVVRTCTKPLTEWEGAKANEMQQAIDSAQSKRKSEEKLVEQRRRDLAKEKTPTARAIIMDEIVLLESDYTQVPVLPKLFSNNVTPESLENETYEQGGCFAVISDEGGVLETLTGLYSNGRANIDLLLKGIDGGDVRISRKDRSINMNPYLTFLLCVQPRIREKMGSNPVLQGNGALERFLYVIPISKIGYRTLEANPMPEHIKSEYHRIITALLNIPHQQNDAGAHEPYVLNLSADALAAFKAFRQWLEPKRRPSGELYYCQGWASKIDGYALRIAGLIHVVEHGLSEKNISSATMNNALNIAHQLISHARVAYTLMGLDDSVKHAKAIYDWLIDTKFLEVTRTQLTVAMKHHLKSPQIDKAIKELEERNMVHTFERTGTGTKKICVYRINPAIYQSTTVTSVNTET